ncbi:MAG: CRTAC1 family protein [Bryobacteraceae bacterium]|nr:CRTAC1 family protein [Bryobacteraceae bacterium]
MLNRRQLLALPLAALAQPAPLFVEVPTAESGIRFVHDNAMSARRHIPETVGGGVAFLDYDNDGWMDIFLVQSGPCDFYQPKSPARNALYKNNRDGTFTDVTEQAGVGACAFGMGVAVGDFDNNGFPDLLVTGYGRVYLYRNNGNGTFTDVTEKAGLLKMPSRWTTSAVWFDYDNDGRLDLFLCSYVAFDPRNESNCGDNKLGRKFYCTPRVFQPTFSLLYHNNGDGTFTEVGQRGPIGKSPAKGLGVVATDINNDRLMDLFVANDTSQNHLFLNRGQGRWEEAALSAEVAFSENGQARSGMGVDAADFNGDGLEDLFVANIDQEMFSLYQNRGKESFEDVAQKHGVAAATRSLSGWGVKFFDYDNDGAVDLILANGHPDDMIEQYTTSVKYKEPLVLFHQEKGLFKNVSAQAGPAFAGQYAARGLAVGDFDNDGRLDVLVGVNGAAPLLLRNQSGAGNSWVGLRLVGRTANRDAIGARITWMAGGQRRSRLKTGGGSYLAAHDPREVLGLGTAAQVDWVEVRWPLPSQRVERFVGLKPGAYQTLVEGTGKTV